MRHSLSILGLALCVAAGAPAAGGSPTPTSQAQAQAEEQQARHAAMLEHQLLMAAYRGDQTEAAAQNLELKLASLRRRPLAEVAPQIADTLGDLVAIRFAAHQVADADTTTRRLVAFARLARDDTMFQVGMRKALAASALNPRDDRRTYAKVLKEIHDELVAQPTFGRPAQLQERLVVAVLDTLGTAAMFDRLPDEALAYFRQARARGIEVYRKIGAPAGRLKEGLTVSCRIFPLAGLLSAQVLAGDIEAAVKISDQMVPLAGALNELGVLPEGHPAREAGEGAIASLREVYRRAQDQRRKETGEDLPVSLEARVVREAEAKKPRPDLADHRGHRHADDPPVAGPFAPKMQGPQLPEDHGH